MKIIKVNFIPSRPQAVPIRSLANVQRARRAFALYITMFPSVKTWQAAVRAERKGAK